MAEYRATDPETGGQKGRKPERFALLPLDVLGEVAKVYAYGAGKYEEHNWRKGYPWDWSMDALMRHLVAWWEGEDLDQESGLNHLAHAAFHLLALMWYQKHAAGKDTRWKGPTGLSQRISTTLANGGKIPFPRKMGDLGLLAGGCSLEKLKERANPWSYPKTEDDSPSFQGLYSRSVAEPWLVPGDEKK